MGFRNSILGGINLVRAAIQSPNYVSGSTGWTIKQDGSAEFNNVVIRGGQVVGGTALYYSGTPAAGNLVMSISATAGTDSFGNAYVAGVGVYGTGRAVTVKAANGDTAVLSSAAPSGIAEASAPGLILSKASGDVTPASLTEFDDTFSRGVYLRSPSPLDIDSSGEGIDYGCIRMTGRFHGSDPQINISAGSVPDAPDGGIWVNGTFFDAGGGITAYGGSWTTFTPSIGGAGGATYSTRTGYWRQWGDDIEFVAYFVLSGAGSGASTLTLTGPPFDIDRTTRQHVIAHLEALGAGNTGTGTALAFQGGSGNVWDRIRTPTNGSLTGADLTATGIITIKGTYRAAV